LPGGVEKPAGADGWAKVADRPTAEIQLPEMSPPKPTFPEPNASLLPTAIISTSIAEALKKRRHG
jgi:hypothetical protein